MAIVPDNKDWTWVLERSCPDCGFAASETTPVTAAASIGPLLPRWQAVLRRPGVAERPDEDTWSPLEYACHVRDVFALFDYRLSLMLQQDNPVFANWDQDLAAEEERYLEQDPAEVSTALVQAGEDLAEAFSGVRPDEWDRRGRRSDGAEFSVRTFSGYFLHDVVHHLHDVDG
jgi:hypothetical protein